MLSKKNRKLILIIDDDLAFARKLSDSLDWLGFEVMVTNNPLAALEIIESFKFELVITSYGISKMSGLEVLSRIKNHDCLIPVIMISSDPDSEIRKNSLAQGASDFFLKQMDFERMLLSIYKKEYARQA
jgi:DNA-binding NtrC family response regulator